MGLYPGSADSDHPATIYGPLPVHGDGSVALVLHTTETRGMPGFNGGDTAPHYVYDATRRRWTMFAEFEEGYVGTLKGHSVGHTNCKAFQVEILAYSAHGNTPWVGDFDEGHYRDLAGFYRWSMERYRIGDDVTPTPAGGWLYGSGSPLRMSWERWRTFSGLTAHGAVPGQTHWDTGVLDLQRIHDLALGETMFTHFEVGDERSEWEPIVWFLFQMAGGVIDANANSSQVQTVLPWKHHVRLVETRDFDMIADVLSLDGAHRASLHRDGLYRYGKEIAQLQQIAYTM